MNTDRIDTFITRWTGVTAAMTSAPTVSTPQSRIRRLNHRQRKKLHLGEFQELGFALRWGFAKARTDVELDRFIDDFIEVMDSLQLIFGGGFSAEGGEGLIAAIGRKSATESDRLALTEWLRSRPEVVSTKAGSFVDVWHDDDY